MIVKQTVVATGPDDQDLGDLVKPVDIQWYQGDSLTAAMAAVVQMMDDSQHNRFTKVLKIEVEF